MKIIAIGGGGFTHQTFPDLDDFCLTHVKTGHPKLGYIGTASNDEPQKVERFISRFAGGAQTTIHLTSDLSGQALRHAIRGLDLIYVGGGDTQKMLEIWNNNGWDLVLKEAYEKGVILAGVSAGAMCWFDQFLFSSG